MHYLLCSLAESIGWADITSNKETTANDQRAYEWGIRCSTYTAAVVCSLGNEDLGKWTAKSRNKSWIEMADTETGLNPEMDKLRIQKDFGSGKRIRQASRSDAKKPEISVVRPDFELDSLSLSSLLASTTKAKKFVPHTAQELIDMDFGPDSDPPTVPAATISPASLGPADLKQSVLSGRAGENER